MRFKLTLTLAALALLTAARAQEPRPDDEQLIEDFVTTRGFVFVEPGAKKSAPKAGAKAGATQNRPRRRPGKGGGAPAAQAADEAASKKKAAGQDGGAGAAAGGAGVADAAVLEAGMAGRPIALGYTLYRKNEGRFVVADPAAVFTYNDRLRLFLETNTDGYIYVFNTTDGASPVMLYPHANVDGGRNNVAAHTREVVPAAAKEFSFDAVPGTERVYVVVARRPLAGVPAGEELVNLCGGAREDCHWQPTPSEWARIEAMLRQGGRAREGRFAQLAQLSASPDTTRGIRVKTEEPPPAFVRVNESPAADLLVATIDLIHK